MGDGNFIGVDLSLVVTCPICTDVIYRTACAESTAVALDAEMAEARYQAAEHMAEHGIAYWQRIKREQEELEDQQWTPY